MVLRGQGKGVECLRINYQSYRKPHKIQHLIFILTKNADVSSCLLVCEHVLIIANTYKKIQIQPLNPTGVTSMYIVKA